MSVRVNQRWPDGLKERIEAKVGKSKVTEYTIETLEKALSGSPSVAAPAGRKSPEDSGEVSSSRSEPASSRASSLGETPWERLKEMAEVTPMFICPTPRCSFKVPSAAATCGVHGRKVVPEPV